MLRSILAIATVGLLVSACAATSDDENPEDINGQSEDAITPKVTAAQRTAVLATDISGYQFDHLTPTGRSIFQGAVYWKAHQLEDLRYPQPRMCASNVSEALYLGGIQKYSAEAVYNLIQTVGVAGGEVHRLPRPTRTDKTAFLAELNAIDGGRIPTGTIVAGCLTSKCDAMPGEQHVGIVGNVDPDGTVWVWHNNWYRPDNENGQWLPFMVYGDNHDLYEKKHLVRQWMPTPWIKVTRDGSGKITDAKTMVAGIDDLDPFGGMYGGNPKYYMTMALIPELAADIHR